MPATMAAMPVWICTGNGKWPGVAMKKEADGSYSYTFEEEWIAPLIIFNDGRNQSNGTLEPGEAVIEVKIYAVE